MIGIQETNIVKFNACKHLDFKQDYTAVLQMLGNGKLFWMRETVDLTHPKMVQFCKLRGRLNSPTACLDCKSARCSDYEESEHVVDFVDTDDYSRKRK